MYLVSAYLVSKLGNIMEISGLVAGAGSAYPAVCSSAYQTLHNWILNCAHCQVSRCVSSIKSVTYILLPWWLATMVLGLHSAPGNTSAGVRRWLGAALKVVQGKYYKIWNQTQAEQVWPPGSRSVTTRSEGLLYPVCVGKLGTTTAAAAASLASGHLLRNSS